MKALRAASGVHSNDSAEISLSACSHEQILGARPADFPAIIQDYQNNEFIAEVFVNYLKIIERRKIELFDSGKLASEAQIVDEIGARAPWDIVNSLLEKYGFSYQINRPIRGMTYIPHFQESGVDQTVAFNSLSTGEQVLVTLVLWAFNTRAKLHKRVFLLDEFDAHLNPALSKMMIEVIQGQLVEKFGLQVILTTHSPSTVVHAPNQSLFWMDRGQSIRKVGKQEAVSRLSNGFMALQQHQVGDIFRIEVSEDQKPILCVEGITDKLILTGAWLKLRPNEDLPVVIRDVFDCWSLTNMFKRGDIFNNYPDTKFWGILDYDDAFKDCNEKLASKKAWSKSVDEKCRQVIFTHSNGRGKLLTLPAPDHRKEYAGPEMRDSYLSIELLFDDEHVMPLCEKVDVAGGGKLLRFQDKHKKSFAEKVKELPSEAFHAFVPLVERIEELSEQ